ncbi:MAG: glycerol-3-phosphate 1-O-acyltransferase PlsY [Deltaproteobacteria bacterium]|uniref:Glycerol-3-phosphate acyltransferase n=1 Tax=Candidatus Desulfacyla euxinica TaxID=2841693 RepID=A0A8J6N2Q1_9DELT|nr:glycerol-3-phosphate 1-O-acyltransferase PlsY [Candidatus Desulfacyla euxinica]
MVFETVLFAIAAYMAGAIPFGKIIARFVAQIDITKRGSGNIGATNVARELGTKWGIITLLLDMLKGFVPVMLFSYLFSQAEPWNETALAGIGICALLGHMFPSSLRFRGGKGVATGLGVYFAFSPLSCLCSLVLFIIIVMIWNYISLASILAVAAMPLFLMLFGKPQPLIIGSLIMALLICYKHKVNIQDLIRGEERRWKDRKGKDIGN